MSRRTRVLLAALVLFALILVPFILWEEGMNQWVNALMSSRQSAVAVAATVALLLAADAILPIPSSIVSTSGGYLLGFAWGLAASWIGMTLGCVGGYALGRFAGRGLLRRLISEKEMERSAAGLGSRGDQVLAASRAVPMLAEASVMVAGVLRRPFARFLAVCSLANFGISLVYAAVGAFSLRMESFVLAFLGAIAVPWIGMRLSKRARPFR